MTPRTLLAGGIADPAGTSGPATLHIEDGRISAIGPGVRAPGGAGDAILDARDLVVTAGLIDLHTHGAAGAQVIDGGADAVHVLARWHAAHGVTGFLATVGGAPDDIRRGISGAVAAMGAGPPADGARCLGIHLEGPFLNPARPGAFVPSTIVPPEAALFETYVTLAEGTLRRMAIAPEMPGATDVIRAARTAGVTLAVGHSQASAVEVAAALELGVTGVTHLFNGMPPLHHRDPGIVGVALTEPRITIELIADGVHVDPVAMAVVAAAKGWAGVALITDSVAAAGRPDGTYQLEGQEVIVRDGRAFLADGTIAGGTGSLDDGVRRFSVAARIPWEAAVGSASLVPARVLGIDDRLGRIRPGADADLVAWDADRRVVWTMVGGRIVYERP